MNSNPQPALSSAWDWQPPTAALPLGDASLSPDVVRQRLEAAARRGRARFAGIDRENRVRTAMTREALEADCWSVWELTAPAAPARRFPLRWPW